MPPVGFETTISAGERQKSYALNGAATGIGIDASTDTIIIYGTENGVKQTTGNWISELYMTTGTKIGVDINSSRMNQMCKEIYPLNVLLLGENMSIINALLL